MSTLRVGWRERGGCGRPFLRPESRPAVDHPGYPDEIGRKTQDVHSRKMRCSSSGVDGVRGRPDIHSRKTQDARLMLTYPIEKCRFRT